MTRLDSYPISLRECIFPAIHDFLKTYAARPTWQSKNSVSQQKRIAELKEILARSRAAKPSRVGN